MLLINTHDVDDSLPYATYERAGATAAPRGEIYTLEVTLNYSGKEEKESVRVYVTKPINKEIEKDIPVVVLVHDLLGFGGGRTHHIADELADEGYIVVAPDFFATNFRKVVDMIDFILSPVQSSLGSYHRMRTPWARVEEILLKNIIPYIRSELSPEGPLAIMGFCWGGWAMVKSLVTGAFSCGIGVHPSPIIERFAHGGDITKTIEKIKCPILLMPTWNDPPDLRVDGEFLRTLRRTTPDPVIAERSDSMLFRSMRHGFANRGDIRDPNVKVAVEDMMRRAKDFLKLNLKEKVFVPKPATDEELREIRLIPKDYSYHYAFCAIFLLIIAVILVGVGISLLPSILG